MKNTNKPFDAELAKRLRNYSEEPREHLWQSIATTAETMRRPLAIQKRIRTGWILILCMVSISVLHHNRQIFFGDNASASIRQSMTSNISSGTITTDPSSTEEKVDQPKEAAPLPPPVFEEPASESIESNHNEARTVVESRPVKTQQNRSVVSLSVEDQLQNISNRTDEQDDVSAEPIAPGQPVEEDKTPEHISLTQKESKAFSKRSDEGTVITEKEKRHNRFNIYFTIMPTFGYQRIKSNSNDDIIIQGIKRVSAFSTDRLGVRAELGVEDPLTPRIKVFGGLVYYQRKQTIDYTEKQVKYTQITEGPDGQIIVVPEIEYVEKSFEYELKNLGVQLGVSYELSRKKLLHTLGTGLEFHLALNKLEDTYRAEFTNNPSAYVFYNLYYRLQYPAEGRLRAVFQPTLNYSFYINQNLNAPFYVKPYGLGLNLGFTYNF